MGRSPRCHSGTPRESTSRTCGWRFIQRTVFCLLPPTQRWLQAQRGAATRRGNDHPIPIAPGKWSGFRTGIISFLEKYDAVLCPVSASPAPPHGTLWNDDTLPAFSYAMTYGLTGMPSVVVRGGTSPEGLPIGIQVVAAPAREDVALAVAQHIETTLDGSIS